ncbi:MAG TPA: iron-sulfur cluster assembly scaffold protein [Dehalococcoidales bacterium]|nr:iron-sulfur cluster assembly scaffold protein [Dehalococcoidales bacterium]
MTDPLDEVQNKIFGDLSEVYSEVTVDHILHPRNVGSLPEPDGFAACHSGCDEAMEIWLKVRDNVIEEIAYWTDGCAATIACGSMATELVKGKTIAQGMMLTVPQIADALVNLPEGNLHCAELAAETLKTALKDALVMQRDPWKKAYRKK